MNAAGAAKPMRKLRQAFLVPMMTLPATTSQDLGVIDFPNSGPAAAQADFIRGVLLLHNFQYPRAAAAFQAAQQAAPDFALAYWGEAMTCNHGLSPYLTFESASSSCLRLRPIVRPTLRTTSSLRPRLRGMTTGLERPALVMM
jgi:hypothetical protein